MAAIVGLAYLPALTHGFVGFDDQTNLVDNPNYRGLGPDHLVWMFTHMDGLYIPLTWLSFAIDHEIWGMEPFGYHLTNVLLHTANAVLFYGLCLRLFERARPGTGRGGEHAGRWLDAAAALAALFFALHPLRVESVAWVTERRDVLSGLLVLLTLRAYVRKHATTSSGFAAAAFGWFGLSLLAKGVGMSLVLVLVVLDVHPLGRLPGRPRAWFTAPYRRVWIEKLPFLVCGLAAAAVAGMAQRTAGALYSFTEYPLQDRIGQVFWALAFYLRKMILPLDLSPLYPFPPDWQVFRLDVLLAALLVLGLSLLLFLLRRRWPAGLAAWICFLAFLAPLLGLAQSGPHIAADRNTYLAMLGWAAVAGGSLLALARWEATGVIPAGRTRLALVASGVVLSLFAVLTWRQISIWSDSITLWRAALRVNPECAACQSNLGNAYLRADRDAEAIPHLAEALRLQPQGGWAHSNLGNVALRAGLVARARQHFEAALALDPDDSVSLVNLGMILIDEGRPGESIVYLERALATDPVNAEGHGNLGLALMTLGRLDEAAPHLREAARIGPDEMSWGNLAILELKLDRAEEAVAAFENALAFAPDSARAHSNLGLALQRAERPADAEAALRRALALDPAEKQARRALMALLLADGRHGDALALLRLLHEHEPADDDTANHLVWLLSTSPDPSVRDHTEAMALARTRLARTAEPSASTLGNAAIAFAEAGEYDTAIELADRARARALAEGQTDLAASISERIATYREAALQRAP